MTNSNDENQIIICPGQGAQAVGMGKAWADASKAAADTFAEADEALGFSISELCFNGPQEELTATNNAQVAIYVTSVACYRGLKEQGKIGRVVATAGLSLGEFTALHIAGAFDFENGLSLVKLRGEAMQEAAVATPSGMVALLRADEHAANDVCKKVLEQCGDDEVLVPANFNSPGQVVVSGSKAACDLVPAVAKEMGYPAKPLPVAGAFHSPLMQPAADRLSTALDKIEWDGALCPVLSNVTAVPHEGEIRSIKTRLVEQLTNPVRWSGSMEWATSNLVGQFIEMAPGKTLGGLMRKISKETSVLNYDSPSA